MSINRFHTEVTENCVHFGSYPPKTCWPHLHAGHPHDIRSHIEFENSNTLGGHTSFLLLRNKLAHPQKPASAHLLAQGSVGLIASVSH